jgi:hypothetical protein
MSLAQYVSAILVAFVTGLLAFRPEFSVALALVALVALFIGISLIEKQANADLDSLTAQVKDLKSKVEMLLLNKGFGR